LPATIRFQGEVAAAVNAAKTAGMDNSSQVDLLRTLTAGINELQKALSHLDHELEHGGGDLLSHAKHMRDRALPAMNDVRKVADRLEGIVADDLWPIPTYRELLFIK